MRADLPEGDVTLAAMLDAFPFQDKIWTLQMTGRQIAEVLEQAFTLERGMIQVSGLIASYDLSRPEGERLVELTIGGRAVADEAVYSASTIGVIAEGGDLYRTFTESVTLEDDGPLFAEVLERYLERVDVVQIPTRGRLIPIEN